MISLHVIKRIKGDKTEIVDNMIWEGDNYSQNILRPLLRRRAKVNIDLIFDKLKSYSKLQADYREKARNIISKLEET